MTDTTDIAMAFEDEYRVICRAPLDALYNQDNRCGCPKCQADKEGENE